MDSFASSLYTFFALWLLASIAGAVLTAIVDTQRGEMPHPISQH